MLKEKSYLESVTVTNEIILPSDTNPLGTAFGGRVMQWIDMCAAICAQRHCRRPVVTASMDELHFHAPIRVGMVAALEARVNATFERSLELEVTVHSENPVTGERKHCCSALLTFAALDDDFRPTTVWPLLLDSDDARRRQAAGAARRAQRLANRKQTQAQG